MLRREAVRTFLALLFSLLPVGALPPTTHAAAEESAARAQGSRQTAWDLIASLAAAGGAPEGVSLVYRGAHRETRAGVRIPSPGSLSVPVEVPPDAELSFGVAFQAAAFMTETPELAEPGRVQIELADADGVKHMLYDRRIDIRNVAADRRWLDERIDLKPLAGKKGTLTFRVLNDGDAAKAKDTNVYLSAPRILVPAAGGASKALNLVLITIDCLRADHVGAYGYGKPTTPTLDRLAADGVRFARAYANAPMTLPSVPQLFTSTIFPTKDVDTLLEPVAQAGMPSAAVVNNVWIPLWLSQGKHAEPPGTFDVMISGELDAREIVDRALRWLERHHDDRFVLYLHFLDTHTPYGPPRAEIPAFADPGYAGKVGDTFADVEGADAGRYDDADRRKIIALYDTALRFIDGQIARVLEFLAKSGDLDRTAIVVTADHGEEFWDHGRFFHGQSLYEEVLHVPLIARVPGLGKPGTVIERPVRLLDVAPSLLEWAKLERPATFQGRPLGEVVAAPDLPSDDVIATATQAQFATRYALRTGDLKLIESLDTGKRELFDLAKDPREQTNLASERPKDVAALQARLDAARAVLRERGYQVKIVGPQSGSAAVEVRLASEPRSGTFLTLDRTSAHGEPRLELSKDGEKLTARAEVDARGTGFRFDRLLSPRNIAKDDKIKFEIVVGGAPASRAVLALGPAGTAASSDVVDVADPALTTTSEPACAAPPAGVRVCVWRYPGEKLAEMPEISDPAVREKLRALGYLQ
ncbi:MAG: sulfatase [Thermodesulfobacteriota bacterium]